MGVLPRPDSRSFGALNDLAVFLACVNQHNVAVVLLRLFIKKLKDSLSACHCHNDGVYLHGELTYVVGELTGHIEEGNYYRDSHSLT